MSVQAEQFEQAVEYQYKLLYHYLGRECVLATFETTRGIYFPPQGIYFGSDRTSLGKVCSKALEHPHGGYIYRFHLSEELKDKINKWLEKVRAINIKWSLNIHIQKPIQLGHIIRSQIIVDT